jgi:hypothetical protein
MFPIWALSSPEFADEIAGMKTFARTTITPRKTKYDVQITAIYEAIARSLSPSKNLISRLSLAAVTKISEIFPPALLA